eukprot:6919910-Lingulodinium_polyedra.AAC.1
MPPGPEDSRLAEPVRTPGHAEGLARRATMEPADARPAQHLEAAVVPPLQEVELRGPRAFLR